MCPMKNTFEIRKAVREDLWEILEIYAKARSFMAANGNPNQWKTTKPDPKLVEQDIENGLSYVCICEGEIAGVMAFIPGEDPTYKVIVDGEWLDGEPYCVVHRIASSGVYKGAGTFMLRWAFEQCGNVRIDTHVDNKVMRGLLTKLGYSYCGIIFLADGDERLAYQKNKNS